MSVSAAVWLSVSLWSFASLPAYDSARSLLNPSLLQTKNEQARDEQTTDEQATLTHLLSLGQEAYDNTDDAIAADYYRQALLLIAQNEDKRIAVDALQKGEAIYGLGRAYFHLQTYEEALPLLEEARRLYETAAKNNPQLEPFIRMDINGLLSAIATQTGGYATALKYAQSALAIAQTNQRHEEAAVLMHDIGAIEADIGQFENADANFRQAIELGRALALGDVEASAVFGLGWLQERQKNFEAAIAHYQTAIALFFSLRQPNDSERAEADVLLEDYQQDIISREARAYNNLGIVHLKQNDLVAAKDAFDQGMVLLNQQLNSRYEQTERAMLIDSIGSLHEAGGDIEPAWTNYLQAWQLNWQSGHTENEIAVLLNIGKLMQRQSEPALAIFFYKQAIIKLETIRSDLQQLSSVVQQRYTRSIESAYRTLADLLLQQGREAEALQVLELLKLQEVKSFLHNEGEGQTAGAQQFNNPAEADLLQVLRALPSSEISLAEFVVHPAVIALKEISNSISSNNQADTPNSQADALNLRAIEALNLVIAQRLGTAALYPLILEDRIELLLLTANGRVQRFTTEVTRQQLSATVNELQTHLQNKTLDAKPAAQQLHQWLIQPLTDALSADQVETILYLPDGVLRYVPLAALHDGNKWLVETYHSYTSTAATIDDLLTPRQTSPGVMAGAFTDSSLVHQVDVGTRSFTYAGLSAAQQEVDSLLRSLPNSDALLNQNFSPENLLSSVGDRAILHLATHAQFIPGEPEDSFILFGDGRTVSLRDLRQWQLPNVDLVVLSACQTASSIEGDGKEILGLGYQIQATGAKAAIASLWSVDDTATAALMSQFYKHLSTGETKADALRAAQLDLLETQAFKDPFDWAGFILIGNGQ